MLETEFRISAAAFPHPYLQPYLHLSVSLHLSLHGVNPCPGAAA
jgi:hypothetical protein